LLVPTALALALSGCDFEIGTPRRAELTYTEDARAAYNEAMSSFRSKEWDDARALFAEVKKLFPYSRYARLAELRLADVDFEQEKYAEAISGYREFIQSHKGDRDIEYARYRMSKALFLDIDDTLLLPPAEERDQATTLEAYKEIRGFLREFPRSRYRSDALYMFEVVTGRLVRHELYVARYYLRQDMFEATVARIDYALKSFPESTLIPEALVLKGETLMKMHKFDEAREVFELVVNEYGGAFAGPAKRFLAEIGQRSTQKSTQKGGQGGEAGAKVAP